MCIYINRLTAELATRVPLYNQKIRDLRKEIDVLINLLEPVTIWI